MNNRIVPSLLYGTIAALFLTHALAAGAAVGPLAKNDLAISYLDITLPTAKDAAVTAVAELKQQKKAAKVRAQTIGWRIFSAQMGKAGLGVASLDALRNSPFTEASANVLGDVGLVLSFAQFYSAIRQHDLQQASQVGMLKNIGLWAMGRFGWRSLGLAAIFLGTGDLVLQEIGNVSITVIQTPFRVTLENYFAHSIPPGPGWLSDKDWFALLWQARATTVRALLQVIRRHLSQFWDLNVSEMVKYCDEEMVRQRLSWLEKKLLVVRGGSCDLSKHLTLADQRAIVDHYIQTRMVSMLHRWFEQELPRRIPIEARKFAAKKLNAKRHQLNKTCTYGFVLPSSWSKASMVMLHYGSWRFSRHFAPVIGIKFTRWAYLKQVRQPTAIQLTARFADSPNRTTSVTPKPPFARGGCGQRFTVVATTNKPMAARSGDRLPSKPLDIAELFFPYKKIMALDKWNTHEISANLLTGGIGTFSNKKSSIVVKVYNSFFDFVLLKNWAQAILELKKTMVHDREILMELQQKISTKSLQVIQVTKHRAFYGITQTLRDHGGWGLDASLHILRIYKNRYMIDISVYPYNHGLAKSLDHAITQRLDNTPLTRTLWQNIYKTKYPKRYAILAAQNVKIESILQQYAEKYPLATLLSTDVDQIYRHFIHDIQAAFSGKKP